jgi:putative glutathione S-transferase
MSTKDTTLQSDIGKMKTEPDGSFKRLDASFRNTIEKGGKFEPATGRHRVNFFNLSLRFSPDRYHLYVSYACREYPQPSQEVITRT